MINLHKLFALNLVQLLVDLHSHYNPLSPYNVDRKITGTQKRNYEIHKHKSFRLTCFVNIADINFIFLPVSIICEWISLKNIHTHTHVEAE